MTEHIIIKAGAGTGKTWTVTEGIYPMLQQPRKKPCFPPSEEQQAIWEAMQKDEYPSPIHMTSFTNDASDQLAERCPKDYMEKSKVTSGSTTSMGLRFAKMAGCAQKIDIYGAKYKKLTTETLGKTRFELQKFKPGLWDAVHDIQKVARLALRKQLTVEQFRDLADHYSIDYEGGWLADAVESTNAVLKAGLEMLGWFDYGDMTYITVMEGLTKRIHKTLIVDEFQDMGRAQQELCLQAGWRYIFIGDTHQAIYGFAGADTQAFERLESWLKMTKAGLQVMPLNMSRRCAKGIVREANKFDPNLMPLPNAPEGELIDCTKAEFYGTVLPKLLKGYKFTTSRQMEFMVICPTNAPLISLMFKLQKQGVKCYVHGKDVTKRMVETVEESDSLDALKWNLKVKIDRILSKALTRSSMVTFDTCEALLEIAGQCNSKDQVIEVLVSMFSDVPKNGYLKLCSIHKSKGLENKTIILWERDRCKSKFSTKPHQKLQDFNLEHVGITRAKERLISVYG